MTEVVTIISLICGVLGSIPSIIYVANRLFYRPKIELSYNTQPLVDSSGILLAIYAKFKDEIEIEQVLLGYNPFSIKVMNPNLRIIGSQQSYPIKEIAIPHEILDYQGRTALPLNILFNVESCLDNELLETNVFLRIRARLPEDKLPPIIDMFPPKSVVTDIKIPLDFNQKCSDK